MAFGSADAVTHPPPPAAAEEAAHQLRLQCTRLGTFHLVLEALGLGASSGAGQAQDLLVVVHQRVEQFLAEYSRLLRLEHLQYHALIAEGLSVAGVGMKQSDGVANETVDVTNRASTECLFACSAQSGNQGIRFSESMIALTWVLMSFFCELLCIG